MPVCKWLRMTNIPSLTLLWVNVATSDRTQYKLINKCDVVFGDFLEADKEVARHDPHAHIHSWIYHVMTTPILVAGTCSGLLRYAYRYPFYRHLRIVTELLL